MDTMRANEKQETWVKWRDNELERARTQLQEKRFILDDEQVHISGERFLVSGRKLVLTGKREGDTLPIVIKWSTDMAGVEEIRDEHRRREILNNIHFANRTMRFPKELYFDDAGSSIVLVSEYIAQEKIFVQLPISEQFFFALSALESQEGTHVATHEHERLLLSMGAAMGHDDYLKQFDAWCENIAVRTPSLHKLHGSLKQARAFLHVNRHSIGRYCGILTHTDFVPHNLRVAGRQIFTLDHTSLIIGCKYESWARFINFMALYNPELERMLLRYVKENRGEDEYLCLRAMRIYKLGFLLQHHVAAHEISEGNLHLLTGERITFWTHILNSVLHDTIPSPEIIAHYKSRAIELRTPEETKRHQDISGWK